MVGLGDLPGGGFESYATAVSADGSVVVGAGRFSGAVNTTEGREAFRWTQAGGMVGLGDLPGGRFGSYAQAVSADGSVVVGTSPSAASGSNVDYSEAFRWTQATGMVGLGIPTGATWSSADAVSADGSVVFIGSNSLSYRWTQATGMVELGRFGVNDASADGMVAAGAYVSPNPRIPGLPMAAIWTPDSRMRDLSGPFHK
jgi:probable HAF family extracellular repeat protein